MASGDALNRSLLPLIQGITANSIKMDEREAQEHVAILTKVLDDLLEKMKQQDELFRFLYKRLFYTGSYYDGLRVKEATEFDINLVLCLPLSRQGQKEEFQITRRKIVGAFCSYKLTSQGQTALANHPNLTARKVLNFFDDGQLNQQKVLRWIQSIVDKTLLRVKHSKVSRINPSASGPARTLKIYTNSGKCIDVDLVPVIQVNWPEWPNGITKDPRIIGKAVEEERFWFMVPKLYKPGPGDGRLSQAEIEALWRIHFPMIERRLIENIGCVKPLIKLLKLLRDKQNWRALSSYSLKTIVMHEIIQNPDTKYWHAGKQGTLLLMVMRKLHSCLINEKIPYLFSVNLNLLSSMSSAEIVNIERRLKRILTFVENDPSRILEFY